MTAFNSLHPFWGQALILRKNGKTLYEISKIAEQEFPELNYYKVRYGMRKANLTDIMPYPQRLYLRKRFEELEQEFDTIRTLRDIIIQTLSNAEEIEEELSSNDDLKPAQKKALESQLRGLLAEAFDMAKETAYIELKVKGADSRLVNKGVINNNGLSIADIQRAIEQTRSEYERILPASSQSMEDIKTAFGSDNVKLIGEVMDEGAADREEEEEVL